MKLLIILSIEEYTDEVRMIMARQKVPIYSEPQVHDFRTDAYQPDIANRFVKDKHGIYSTLFFSIQGEDCVKRIMDEVRAYNEGEGDNQQNPLHA